MAQLTRVSPADTIKLQRRCDKFFVLFSNHVQRFSVGHKNKKKGVADHWDALLKFCCRCKTSPIRTGPDCTITLLTQNHTDRVLD